METYMDSLGQSWMNGDVLSYGTYGGGGSVAAANIKWLREYAEKTDGCVLHHVRNCSIGGKRVRFHVFDDEDGALAADIVIVGNGWSYSAFVRTSSACPGLVAAVEALSDYPAFDDELVSEVEDEWEQEAWDSWAKQDLIALSGETHRNLPAYIEHGTFEKIPNSEDFLWRAYRQACDELNVYPIPEYDSVDILVDRIAPVFADKLIAMLREYYLKKNYAWRKNWCELPNC